MTNPWQFSLAGARLAGRSGILELMDDLGRALTTDPGMRMLGGGNPAHIPAADAIWRRRMGELMSDSDALERMLGNYDPPRGNPPFLQNLAGFLNRACGWDITPAHLAITAGGQSAFFYLFNLLAGPMPDGGSRRILLPLVPEYIGYANQGLSPDLFVACQPEIEILPDHEFKYRVHFPSVEAALAAGNIGAICVSRPTNPTGNVLTNAEIARLSELAKAAGIPLIIDNAYGLPFPGAVFLDDATPVFDEHIILTLSLSKLGLPGTRTGIVVARPEITEAIAAMTSVVGLANTNAGQQLVLPLLESGEILSLAREVIRPFYENRAREAGQWMREAFGDDPGWSLHRCEGSFFRWLRLTGLPIPTRELYQRLKARQVLVVPGENFFFGLDADWPHRTECLRLNCSGNPGTVREALHIIADEVRNIRLHGTISAAPAV
ncbi:MAG: valine--pyruvate transaminase [Verrucomicrobiaceae bacterium]|nr:MAG: valine--pyruvate transaminase [Verrucomicrobiaceae bacterium]